MILGVVAIWFTPLRTLYTCSGSSGLASSSLAGLGRIAHPTPFESVSSGALIHSFVLPSSLTPTFALKTNMLAKVSKCYARVDSRLWLQSIWHGFGIPIEMRKELNPTGLNPARS